MLQQRLERRIFAARGRHVRPCGQFRQTLSRICEIGADIGEQDRSHRQPDVPQDDAINLKWRGTGQHRGRAHHKQHGAKKQPGCNRAAHIPPQGSDEHDEGEQDEERTCCALGGRREHGDQCGFGDMNGINRAHVQGALDQQQANQRERNVEAQQHENGKRSRPSRLAGIQVNRRDSPKSQHQPRRRDQAIARNRNEIADEVRRSLHRPLESRPV
jgi:hypothetical protein